MGNFDIIRNMASLKQIMYGVTDFARMRAENAYFVDKRSRAACREMRFQNEFKKGR